MRMSRRFLAVLTCMALLLSFSSVVFADSSRTFFITDASGYRCIGSGRITGTTGKTIFSADRISSTSEVIPPTACSTSVWVYVYDQNGRLLGAELNNEDTVSATAEYTADTSIGRIECSFEFNDVDLGYYTLYNS